MPKIDKKPSDSKQSSKPEKQNASPGKPASKPSAESKPAKQTKASETPSTSPEPSEEKSSKAGKGSKKTQRPVVYEKISVKLHNGDTTLTFEQAKTLLGYITESENIKFGGDYTTTNADGDKVRCLHNVRNRPIYRGTMETYTQEVLNKRWRLNGETLIIGKTGITISGQHRLLGFIDAVLTWRKEPGKWINWQEEPTFPCIIVYGVDEDDETVNTIDTGKPRSLADVLYNSKYFAKLGPHDRRVAARAADYCVRTLWDRTHAGEDAWAPKRTHAESMDFIARHERMLDCVRHIIEEDGGDGKISKLLSLGTAAGCCYLMATSATEYEREDKKGYGQVDTRSEAQLDFELWDKAQDFWTELAGGKKLEAVRAAIAAGQETTTLSQPEIIGVLVRAWEQYANGKAVKADHLQLDYTTIDGVDVLAENPKFGGIDLGPANWSPVE